MFSTAELLKDYDVKLHAFYTERDRLQKRIDNAQKRLEKHNRNYPHWTDLVRVICNAICEKTGWKWDNDTTTFGCRAECPIFFKDSNNDTMCYIRFTPHGSSSFDYFTIHYDTGVKDKSYQRGSIGELNGFNNETAPLPDTIDEIIEKCNLKGKE